MTLGDLHIGENGEPEVHVKREPSVKASTVKKITKISRDLTCANFHGKQAEIQYLKHLLERLEADCVALITRSVLKNLEVRDEGERKNHVTILDQVSMKGVDGLNAAEGSDAVVHQQITCEGQVYEVVSVPMTEIQSLLVFIYTNSNCNIDEKFEWLTKNRIYVEHLMEYLVQFQEKNPLPEEDDHDVHSPIETASAEQKVLMEKLTDHFEKEILKRRVKSNCDDFWETVGRSEFKKSMWYYIENNKRLLFALPAFPCKSSNTKTKVLGKLPDLGEKLALQRVEQFLLSLRPLYPPGGHLVLFSDGRVYCDLFGIADDTTTGFIKQLRRTYATDAISFSDLDMFFGKFGDDEKRQALVTLCGTSPENIYKNIMEDSDFREVYCGFQRFLLDELTLPNGVRDKAGRRMVTERARQIMMRTYSYGNIMKVLFPHHIRWSIHPSRCSTKFSINLVGRTDWGTPWHNCALLQPDGTYTLVRRKTAEEKGFELSHTDEGLPFFINNSGSVFIEKL